MWCSCLTDSDLIALPVADRWRWAAFGTYVKQHGERGTITFPIPNPMLAVIFDVAPDDVLNVIKRLPNMNIEEGNLVNGKVTVTIRNWYKFQEDSTVSERVTRLRSKRRGEERRKEESIPPVDLSPPTPEFAPRWNAIPGVKPVRSLTGSLKDRLRRAWRDHPDQGWWSALFTTVAASDFLCGRTARPFHATLEWVLRPHNLDKVLAGDYDNRANPQARPERVPT